MTIDFAKARETMVEQQVRPWDVFQPRVLETLARLPRERFVADAHRALAYSDLALPIGHGESTLKPVIEGRALEALSIGAGEDVLEIGTGSGYLTACLGALARDVVSLERHADLAEAARGRGIGRELTEHALAALKRQGIHKVALVAMSNNRIGNAFWERLGFTTREDLCYRNRSLDVSEPSEC